MAGEGGCLTAEGCALALEDLLVGSRKAACTLDEDLGATIVAVVIGSLRGTGGGGLKSSGSVGRLGSLPLRASGFAVPSSAAMALTLRRLGCMGTRTVSGS